MILLDVLLIICILLGVAFITLLERKILGGVQLREGPNKVGLNGVFQPFSDAMKLFLKENNIMFNMNLFMYFLFPLFSLGLMLLFWFTYVYKEGSLLNLGVIFILVVSSLSSYVILGGGWASNSKYSLLGAYRGVAQVISYEVGFSFIVLFVIFFSGSFSLDFIGESGLEGLMVWSISLPIFFIWFISVLAEVNRSPFDFSEGESELVSGFNTEYGAGCFALLFMAEYGNIFFMGYLTSIIFLNMSLEFSLFVVIFIVLVRGTYVRFRYDTLMMLAWKVFLPNVILILFLGLLCLMLFC